MRITNRKTIIPLIVFASAALETRYCNNALLFVKIISPPTHTANTLTGSRRTRKAEIGAAIIPPTLNAMTKPQLIWLTPKKIIKLNEAEIVTKNSLAETVPIA